MATIVEMINPLTGLPEQVDKLDHTAQEIDDAADLTPQLSNPNLLDNWYFGNPVNQRGQTSYTGSGYGIDRWYCESSNGGVTVNNGSITFLPGTYFQKGEAIQYELLKGKTVTLSLLDAENHLYYGTGAYGSIVNIPIGSSGWFMSMSYYDAQNNHIFRFTNGASEESKNIVAVKLELGSQQTLAHQDENGNWVLNEIPDYGEQLRRCQRYFWRSWTGDRNTHNSILGVVFGTNNRITGFDYPVEMRTKPSITVYGLTGAGKVTEFASDADYGPASPAYWGTQRCVALACDGAGLSNDNRVYYFIEANAEL